MVDASFSELTADQRLKQLAAILARGVRRLKQAAWRVPTASDKEGRKTPEEGLESGADPRLTGSRRCGFYCTPIDQVFMPLDIDKEMAALERTTAGQLANRFAELFSEQAHACYRMSLNLTDFC